MLFHISEEPGITRFEPRPSPYAAEPVVWAIDANRLRNYLLPRDCPRVTFYAGPETTTADIQQFLGANEAVVAIENRWLKQVMACRLYCYGLPPETFQCVDQCAGYYVSRQVVVPTQIAIIDDVLSALRSRDVELRLMPELWSLHDAVAGSTLRFSMIRMRNAAPRG